MVKREKSEQKHFLQLLLIISINVGVFSHAPLNERVVKRKKCLHCLSISTVTEIAERAEERARPLGRNEKSEKQKKKFTI